MISDSKKFVHIHLVKTGGTSRNEILSKYLDRKIGDQPPPDIMKSIVNENFDELDGYFKFTFVRNPWDLVVSFFRERMVQSGRGRGQYKDNAKSFRKFVDDVEKGRVRYNITHDFIQNQLSFLTKDGSCKGSLFVDFVGRFENLKKDWEYVAEKINVEKELPHLRKSTGKNKKHYSEYYDEKSKNIIQKLYKHDIKYFKYKFQKNNTE